MDFRPEEVLIMLGVCMLVCVCVWKRSRGGDR